jgi:hypothetical protein
VRLDYHPNRGYHHPSEVFMPLTFTSADIKKIEKVLGTAVQRVGDTLRFKITGTEPPHRSVVLEVYARMRIGKKTGSMVSVFTDNAHLQLHFLTAFVVSESLGEVTFVAEAGEKLSGLIVERGAGCSLFANVDRSLVSSDFTTLAPQVMMSGIALSLSDSSLEPPARQRKPVRRTARSRSRA